MKKLFKYILMFSALVILMPTLASATVLPPDPPDPIPPDPGPGVESELAEKLCEIRQLFCPDDAGGVLMVIAVVFLGILVLNGKMHWTIVLLIFAGMTIFANAEYMPEKLTDQDVEINDNCECFKK